jgi:hypothetical protein
VREDGWFEERTSLAEYQRVRNQRDRRPSARPHDPPPRNVRVSRDRHAQWAELYVAAPTLTLDRRA